MIIVLNLYFCQVKSKDETLECLTTGTGAESRAIGALTFCICTISVAANLTLVDRKLTL